MRSEHVPFWNGKQQTQVFEGDTEISTAGLEKKKASRSLRAAGLFSSFTFHRAYDHPEGGRMGSSVCALAKTRNSLAA
jgi:hypothetical protein